MNFDHNDHGNEFVVRQRTKPDILQELHTRRNSCDNWDDWDILCWMHMALRKQVCRIVRSGIRVPNFYSGMNHGISFHNTTKFFKWRGVPKIFSNLVQYILQWKNVKKIPCDVSWYLGDEKYFPNYWSSIFSWITKLFHCGLTTLVQTASVRLHAE